MSVFDIFRVKKEIPAPWSKYYSKKELKIKISDISMYDELKNSVDRFKDNTAYQYFNSKVSYRSFLSKIDRAALSFRSMGIKKGDIVTICLPNVPEALISVYALNKIGAIANMLHPLSAPEEIKYSVNRTKSKCLIIIDLLYDKVKDYVVDLDPSKIIFVSVGYSMDIVTKVGYNLKEIKRIIGNHIDSKYMNFKKFMKLPIDPKKTQFRKFGRNTPAVILHSGGTSGTPKNVVIQNRAFSLAVMQEKITLKRLKPKDGCLAIMPNFHGFGLSVSMHTPLVLGYYVILVPSFNSRQFDKLLDKTKPAIIIGVPTLYEALTKSNNVKDLDLSCLKYAICGGDMLTKSLEERVNKYLLDHNSKIKISQGYGMTEALAAVCLGCDERTKEGSIGIPFPGNYIKIIDPSTRKTLKYGEVGEICIHSMAFMLGYLNNESETNDALQIHKDGHIWLHTGDLGCMDEDGFVFYKGRQKRMIVSSGYNVYPSHIEEVIESHPAVLQCTVVGVPHPYKQEVAKAFIVLKEGHHGMFIKSEIKDYCKKNLAHYMVPYQFVYRKKLPTTKLGKVDFMKLKSDIGEDDV